VPKRRCASSSPATAPGTATMRMSSAPADAVATGAAGVAADAAADAAAAGVAAETRHLRLHQADGECRCDDGIDCIAACAQHGEPRVAGERARM
jgi:hypothetical protein